MSERDALQLSSEEMRAFGYRVIDLLVGHVEEQHDGPIGRKAGRGELEALLREPVPHGPGDPMALLDRLQRDVFANMLHVDHPRFFSFVPGPSNFVSVMAETLATGFNSFSGTWFAGSGPAQIELIVVDWLRQICAMPETAGGLFVSGGSMANLTGLAVARNAILDDKIAGSVAYTSDQTHSSVARALRVLGFAADQIRVLPSDADFQLDMKNLEAAVTQDRAAGRRPFCIIANAGTTNSGAVDPLPQLSALCGREAMWLHVDGAYGAPAVLTEKGKPLLQGLGLADSLSLDPHKWLFQSFETGCVLVRDQALLRDTFQVMPEYLRDTEGVSEEVNFGNYGIQLTRSFRALKLWMSLQVFGLDKFRAAIARGIALAETTETALVDGAPEWEVITPARLGVICFRYRPEGWEVAAVDRLQGQIVEAMMADGYALATSTVLKGRPALRFCTINPRTSDDEIYEAIRRMAAMGQSLSEKRDVPAV